MFKSSILKKESIIFWEKKFENKKFLKIERQFKKKYKISPNRMCSVLSARGARSHNSPVKFKRIKNIKVEIVGKFIGNFFYLSSCWSKIFNNKIFTKKLRTYI